MIRDTYNRVIALILHPALFLYVLCILRIYHHSLASSQINISQRESLAICSSTTTTTSSSSPDTSKEMMVPSSPSAASNNHDGDDGDQNRAAGTISISGNMCRQLRRLLISWILFSQDKETGKIFVEPQEFSMEDLMASLGEEPVMLALGLLLKELELAQAELVSLNGMICRGVPLEKVQDLLIMLEGDFTMTFVKPDGDEWTKRMVVIKPLVDRDASDENVRPEQSDGTDGTTCSSSFWANLSFKMEPVEKELTKIVDKENNDESSSTLSGAERTENVQVVVTGQKELCLGPVPSTHPIWLQQTPLTEGDRLLAVNEKTSIAQLHPDDVELTISFLFQCAPAYLSLLVWTPPSKRGQSKGWRKILRKGAIAVTGGAMVGAGAVLMVTPLHPLGHVMAFGGVGVLGTEFQRPRQAAKRASAGFSNMTSSWRRSLHERKERRASSRNNKDMTTPGSSFGEDEDTSSTTVSSSEVDSLSGIPNNVVESKC